MRAIRDLTGIVTLASTKVGTVYEVNTTTYHFVARGGTRTPNNLERKVKPKMARFVWIRKFSLSARACPLNLSILFLFLLGHVVGETETHCGKESRHWLFSGLIQRFSEWYLKIPLCFILPHFPNLYQRNRSERLSPHLTTLSVFRQRIRKLDLVSLMADAHCSNCILCRT